jgi:hypothetical protein
MLSYDIGIQYSSIVHDDLENAGTNYRPNYPPFLL